MTIIVGFCDKARQTVYIGGDACSSTHSRRHRMSESKVFRNGRFLIGSAGSHRNAQILEHVAIMPVQDASDPNDMRFLVGQVIPAVQKALHDGGAQEIDKDVRRQDANWLLGYRARLYEVYGDYQVRAVQDDFVAVGCGEEYALGSMHSTGLCTLKPPDRLALALAAAVAFSPFCDYPVRVDQCDYDGNLVDSLTYEDLVAPNPEAPTPKRKRKPK